MASTALDPAAATALIDELLDAHLDTVVLLSQGGSGEEWAQHVRYVQALRRHTEAMLARSTEEGVRTPHR